jgi:hypothetical protein
MDLQHLKNAVTSKVGRQILLSKKHSPTILFAGGVVGVVGATVMACRATLKLEEVLDEVEEKRKSVNELMHKDYSDVDRINDHRIITVQAAASVAKLYAPAVAVGVVSIAALTGSHVVLSKRNAAVMAAYSALDKGFNEYRARVRDELGDEKDQEFRHGTKTVEETVESDDGKKTIKKKVVVPDVPSVYARFFDEGSKSWSRQPEYNQLFLNCQQNYANDLLRARGHVFLNEVYDMLGLERTKAGAVVGWILNGDGDNFVDFGIYDGKNERTRAFVNGDERSILLDFNVDGVIYDLI